MINKKYLSFGLILFASAIILVAQDSQQNNLTTESNLTIEVIAPQVHACACGPTEHWFHKACVKKYNMSNQEILDQIAKFEKGLSNPNIPESTKNTIKSKIEGLKAQLEKVEEKVEKKEQKLEAEEKKIQSELEDNIAKWEKGLNNPNIPASAKEAIKKKIAAAKEEGAAVKKRMDTHKMAEANKAFSHFRF